jgi:hypothetical protein
MDSRFNGSCTLFTAHFSDQLGYVVRSGLVATIPVNAFNNQLVDSIITFSFNILSWLNRVDEVGLSCSSDEKYA